MDVYSEQMVTDALFRLMEGRTTVLISHDMKILERADYIVVVNQGSIEAEGTVEAVKKSSPMLQSLLTANR
jgi:ABC-type transport system involved in cytochrome bd biosynthesis fused ATPase/permease subunit